MTSVPLAMRDASSTTHFNGKQCTSSSKSTGKVLSCVDTSPSFMKFYQNQKRNVSKILNDVVRQLDKAMVKSTEQLKDTCYMQDDLHSLLNHTSHESIKPSLPTKRRIGKPILRYPSSTPLMAVSKHTKWENTQVRPELYHKVEQIEWENDIVWENSVGSVAPFADEIDDLPYHKYTIPHATSHINFKQTSQACIQYLDTYIPNPEPISFDMKKPNAYRWELPSMTRPIMVNHPTQMDCALNTSLQEDGWLDAIAWDNCSDMPLSQIILDDNDPHLFLYDTTRPTLHVPVRQLGAYELQQKQNNEQDKHIHHAMEMKVHEQQLANNRIGKVDELVHHSPAAANLSLTQPELSKSHLRAFHRPRGSFRINRQFALTHQNITPNMVGPDKLIVVEYIEQRPPMLSNAGMASRMVHFWRPSPRNSLHDPPVTRGQVVVLGTSDDAPLLGDVPKDTMVTSLVSSLFKVPLVQHEPRASMLEDSDEFDYFLLTRSNQCMQVMELPTLYVAGQIEPQMQVPAPNSIEANNFLRSYMPFHTLRLFQTNKNLKMENVQHVFPSQSLTAIRKCMKKIATFERSSGWWTAHKKTLDDYVVSPESVCLYESQMSGHLRLIDMGLTKLISPIGVQNAIDLLLKRLVDRQECLRKCAFATAGFDDEEKAKTWYKKDTLMTSLKHDIQIARSIALQLELTPWTWTNNYVEYHLTHRGMLELNGDGDPSGCGDGFSFIRAPSIRGSKPAQLPIESTTSDLRKLHMKEAGRVLKNLGVDEYKIKSMKRWDRIAMIRALSQKSSSLNKFERRKTAVQAHKEYRQKCDLRYKQYLEMLASTQADFDDVDDSDDELSMDELSDDIFGTPLSSGNVKNSSSPRLQANHFERNEAAELECLRKDIARAASTIQHKRQQADSSMFVAKPQPKHHTHRQAIKRVTRTIQQDGTETMKIEFIVDPVKIAEYLTSKQHQVKQKCEQSKNQPKTVAAQNTHKKRNLTVDSVDGGHGTPKRELVKKRKRTEIIKGYNSACGPNKKLQRRIG